MPNILLKIFFLQLFIMSVFAQEKITLQLKWFHQFQFAGYYAAKEKGFYKDLGLDVTIKQRDINYNNIEQVINGDAQYGVADSILILYKAKEEPVVIVAPILQHSPSVLISLKSSGINSPYNLDGKEMVFYPSDTDGFSILAMMRKLHAKPNLIRIREKNDYLKLIDKKVDLFPAYLSNEPFYFQQRGIPINTLNPTNYGFDLYGDMLFTNKNEAKNHPNRVQKFKEATLRGWRYALENQEEIIQLIHSKYGTNKSIEHLRYEAKAIEKLISKDTIPLGTIDKGRIRYITNLYNDYGTTNKDFNINDFIFKEYIIKQIKIDLTEEEKKYLENNPSLKVQNMLSFPPYNFYENEEESGYTIDYINLVAKALGVEIEFVNGKTWEESLLMLKNNEIDIIPNIAINKERQKYITYTNFEHINYQISLAVRKSTNIKSFKDLKKKTLAVLNKSFLHTIIKTKYPNQKLYLASTTKDAVESVSKGKADAVIDNLATVEYYISHNWLSNLKTIKLDKIEHIPSNTALHMGVSKDNTILKMILEKVNATLPHNEIVKLKEKWLNLKIKRNVQFTNEEYSYLQGKKELHMCVDPNWMPFEKIQNNKHIGMTADYIKLFEKLIDIPINLTITENWMDTIKKAKNKECDFVTVMLETKERKKQFNFTRALTKMPLVVATKLDKPFISEIKDILPYKVAMVKGFAYSKIFQEKYPSMKLIEVKNAKEGLKKVDQNQVYGFIGVLPVIGFNIQENFLGNLKIAGKLNDNISFPMATRKDEPLLNDIFNKLINSISEEEKRDIMNKWLSIKYEESIDYKSILYIIIIFLIIIFIIVTKNRAINKINETLSKYVQVIDEHVLTSTTDTKGNITSVSQAFCDISEYSKDELIGTNHSLIRHEDMTNETFDEIWSTISKGNIWKGEIKNKKKNGGYYWVDATVSPVFDDKKRIIAYTAIRHNITDKKKIEEISITDELTTLYNKRYFNQIFEKELNNAKRHHQDFALAILDVDFFKQYNDFYGHQKGDYVLENIGKALKSVCKRSSDTPFRIGGEEFGIIFVPDTKDEAVTFMKTVNQEIENLKMEHKYNKASDYITVSIGLYTNTGDMLHTTKEIYHFADTALYEAKSKGRNQYILYNEDLNNK